MTREPERPRDAEDPGPDAAIAALLGALAPAEPIPDEVGDRIEAALRAEPAPGAAARPARSGALRLLGGVAAAVIVLGGGAVAVSQLHGGGSSGSAASNSTVAGTGADGAAGSANSAPTTGGSPARVPSTVTQGRVGLPALSRAHFPGQVRRLLAHRARFEALPNTAGLDRAPSSDCTAPRGHARDPIVEISLDGRLAQLVVSGTGSGRVATAYDCAGTRVLASTPAPR